MSIMNAAGWTAEFAFAIETAQAAAAEIARFYAAGGAGIYAKGDDSPVTDADLASDRIIRERVAAAFPDDALLTEEGADDSSRLTARRCWLADPLDGTQDFIDRTGQFDVFLSLIVAGRPVVGVACHPPSGLVLAAAVGAGAWLHDSAGRRPLRLPDPGDSPRLNTNRYHTGPDAWPLLRRVAARAGCTPPNAPSPFYPRAFFGLDDQPARYEAHLGVGPIEAGGYIGGEWDLAAPDVILAEAGGLLTDERGDPIRYNQPDPMLRHGVIAASSRKLHARIVTAFASESNAADDLGPPRFGDRS